MICINCGKENTEGSLFCSHCGRRMERRSGTERRQSERRQTVPLGGETRTPRATGPALRSEEAVLPARLERPGLDKEFAATTQEPRREPSTSEARQTYTSGPSLLGLGEPASDYLFVEDDQPRERSYSRFIALVVILVAVGLVAANWDRIKHAATAARDSSPVASTPAPPAPSAPAPAAEASPAAENPASNTVTDEKKPDNADNTGENKAAEADQKPDTAKPADTKQRAATGNETANEEVPQDDRFAEDTTQAASQEDAVRDAEKYLYGIGGTNKDCGQALAILNRAAGEGNAAAQTKLGILYSTGNCVEQDRVQAYQWFDKASHVRRSGFLERTKNDLWAQMSPDERQRVGAR